MRVSHLHLSQVPAMSVTPVEHSHDAGQQQAGHHDDQADVEVEFTPLRQTL